MAGPVIERARRHLSGHLSAYGSRPRWVRWAAVVGWASMIWFASSRPSTGGAASQFWIVVFNAAHVVFFGVLAALLYFGIEARPRVRVVSAFALAVAYGVGDELHQTTVEGRHASVWDVLSDAVGAALFTALLVWIQRREHRALWSAVALLPCAAATVLLASR